MGSGHKGGEKHLLKYFSPKEKKLNTPLSSGKCKVEQVHPWNRGVVTTVSRELLGYLSKGQ